jgi:hypothetical protein
MTPAGLLGKNRKEAVCRWLVLSISAAIALISARPYAGSWNDGSRLATVECLVDYHTLAIDRSIFVQVPPPENWGTSSPYPLDEPDLLLHGTGDKLWIHGHYYSDKSPVPALLLAGVYQGWRWCTGATARQRPDSFCYWMTFVSAGLPYVIAVYCIYQLGGPLRLQLPLRLALTASFALATVALPYVRQVNNHILLLGVAAALFLVLARLAQGIAVGKASKRSFLAVGSLAGLGYTTDLGAGPVLLICTWALVAFRCRRLAPVSVVGLAALPWLVLHHGMNYLVGGTFKPANAVPEYFQWPGCTFNAQNLTGSWQHASVVSFLIYAADLLVGKRGFLGYNPPLLLAIPALLSGWRQHRAERPELLSAAAWCGGTWLLYALTSTNSAGQCCSIRWFVPLLAPGYYALAVFLRDARRFQWEFAILSGCGAVIAWLSWRHGPWMKHMVPFYWPLQGALLGSLVFGWVWRRRHRTGPTDAGARGRNTLPKAA